VADDEMVVDDEKEGERSYTWGLVK